MGIINLKFLPIIIFIFSIIGIIINRSNIILILICIEIMLLSVSLNFLINAFLLDSLIGQISAIYVITSAAVESAIGLSIMVSFYKIKGSIAIRFLNTLKG